MKKILLLLLLAVCLPLWAGAGFAETITIGDRVITYEIPQDYVEAKGQVYAALRNVVQTAMPAGVQVRAIYATQDADAAFRAAQGRDGLGDYLIITSIDALEEQLLTTADFADFKHELKNNYDLAEDARAIVDQRLEDIFEGRLQIGGMQSLGCFGESDTALSYTMLLEMAIDNNELPLKQVLVLTGIYVNEKLLFLNQYSFVNSEDEVAAFKTKSQQVLAQMAFSAGQEPAAAAEIAVQPPQPQEPDPKRGNRIIFIVVAVVLIVAGIVLKRRNAAKLNNK